MAGFLKGKGNKMERPRIPDEEFKERAVKLQTLMRERGIDILLAFGNEAEPQFARYLCDYWPSFESTDILQTGEIGRAHV